MGKFSKCTVDASVLLKLVVEEEYSLQASKIAADFGDGRVALYAPGIIDYEIGSVLYKMTRDRIIGPKYAEEAFGRLLNLPVAKVALTDFVAVLRLSNSLGVHFYDCHYIMAARESRTALVSADEKMVKAAKSVLPTDAAVHIKDFEAG
ncbi:MAG: type II toxin-antitoxin system VapC family toxin [Nitrososphaera sp.]